MAENPLNEKTGTAERAQKGIYRLLEEMERSKGNNHDKSRYNTYIAALAILHAWSDSANSKTHIQKQLDSDEPYCFLNAVMEEHRKDYTQKVIDILNRALADYGINHSISISPPHTNKHGKGRYIFLGIAKDSGLHAALSALRDPGELEKHLFCESAPLHHFEQTGDASVRLSNADLARTTCDLIAGIIEAPWNPEQSYKAVPLPRMTIEDEERLIRYVESAFKNSNIQIICQTTLIDQKKHLTLFVPDNKSLALADMEQRMVEAKADILFDARALCLTGANALPRHHKKSETTAQDFQTLVERILTEFSTGRMQRNEDALSLEVSVSGLSQDKYAGVASTIAEWLQQTLLFDEYAWRVRVFPDLKNAREGLSRIKIISQTAEAVDIPVLIGRALEDERSKPESKQPLTQICERHAALIKKSPGRGH
jgi:hypothetical protein